MKKLGLKIIGVMIVVIILLQINMINIVVAAEKITQSDIDKQKNEQNQTASEKKEKEKELKDVQGEKKEVQKQVQDLSSQISNYEEQIETLDNQISDLNTKIKDSEEKLKQAQQDYTQKEDLLEKRLVATYESGETSYLDFLLSSESITDFISNYFLVTEVATYDTELLEKIQKQKEEIEEAKKHLEEDKEELATSKASKQSVTAQLQVAKKEKSEQVAQLSKDEQVLQNEIDELDKHEREVSDQIKKMTTEYNKQNTQNPPANNNNAGNSGNSGGTGNSNNTTSSYGFGWPVSNNRIGTAYGVKGSMWSLGYHTGVDFPVSSGTPVFSVGNGQVVDTGYNSAYGNFVEIYHGNSVYSFYAHATRVQVSRGQKVSKGQQIMISGATGNVSGAHLHFEIRSPGSGFKSCVNPMNYLP